MKKALLILFILFCAGFLLAQEKTLLVKDYDLKVFLSFDKAKYRLGEETFLNIEVNNDENDVVHFYTSPYKLNNIKIEILNLQQGTLLEEKYSKLIEINNLKQQKPELFLFKQTSLYPDEVLKFRLNLQEYFDFPEPGRYKIKVEFDPFPQSPEQHKTYLSNPVYLTLDKSAAQNDFDEIVSQLKKIEEAKSYTPDGTIRFMLDAYIRKDWANYFLYQNLPSLILQYDPFKEKYLNASMTMKPRIIEDFKNWIMKEKNKEIDNYQVLEFTQSDEENKATVRCRIRYKKPATLNTYYYLYTLHRDGIKWHMDDVEVLSYSKEK